MKPTRVLLVDDDDGIRTALSSLLRAHEFEIAGEAGDGHTGLSEAGRLKPDIVLLDVTMPGLSGLEALPKVRECLPSAGIIVMTSDENPTYRDQALLLGANAFVSKQRMAFDLIPTIQTLLRGLRSS